MIKERLLIVDDEEDLRNGLKRVLARKFPELDIVVAGDAAAGLAIIAERNVDLMLLDVKMPGMNGIEMLKELNRTAAWLTTIMMTGYASIEMAVEAIKLGAYDFITKPFDREALCRLIGKGLERKRLIKENLYLKQQIGFLPQENDFIGNSPVMLEFLGQLKTIARTSYTTLVRGQSGTGKELAARAIHRLSERREKPFIMVNCPAIPEHLLESELFGYVRGAFTGADRDRVGYFVEADGGTICLDEVGDLPVRIQSKLLRVLQEQEVTPLGSGKTRRVDVRVIAMTNIDLEEMIAEKAFREDLFYRLNVVTLQTPSLVEIAEDIPLLAAHFCEQVCKELQLSGKKRFSRRALDYLARRHWPGNVRELQNVVRRAVMFAREELIEIEELQYSLAPPRQREKNEYTPEQTSANDGDILEYKAAKEDVLESFTQNYLRRLLRVTSGNVTRAAEISGVSRTSLQKIMRRYEINSSTFRGEK
ncbi:MAG: DNA-binding response regulator [Desulfobacterales bacterium]|nr:MAG: DNA-binding response regulator [Desulfobacterales bacterium]